MTAVDMLQATGYGTRSPQPEARSPKPSWFEIRCEAHADQAVIYIFDEIGMFGVSANDFAEQLQALGDVDRIELHVNSPGGSVFDGLAIYNLLKRHPAEITVFVDGLAASIASVIVMVGATVIMPENALLMLHRPTGRVVGGVDDMRRMADLLEKTEPGLIAAYRAKSGLSDEKIAELMDAETWLTAEEALELGFADRTEEAVKIAAHFDLSKFKQAPASWPVAHKENPMPDPKAQNQSVPEPAGKTEPKSDPSKPGELLSTVLESAAPAATLAEIKSALPDASAEFLVASLEQSATLAQAKDAWLVKLRANNATLKAQAAEQQAELEDLKSKGAAPGLEPLSGKSSADGSADGDKQGSAIERFNERVTAKVKSHGLPRHEAWMAVCSEDPELRMELVADHNARHRAAG